MPSGRGSTAPTTSSKTISAPPAVSQAVVIVRGISRLRWRR